MPPADSGFTLPHVKSMRHTNTPDDGHGHGHGHGHDHHHITTSQW